MQRPDGLCGSSHRGGALERAYPDAAEVRDAGRPRLRSSAPSACVGAGKHAPLGIELYRGPRQPIRVRSASMKSSRCQTLRCLTCFGRQWIVSSLPPPTIAPVHRARLQYPRREQSRPMINSVLAITWTAGRISGSCHHFRIIARRPRLENPIGFDKPRAILKIPKTGIQ